ncbi:MAG: hypothetical protein UY23_C0001G0109 [Candidatus Jorgensenbacteria bacterium GW2011_GWA1_48_11]|uniref:Uncharacterized protein n=1 Tax=Candidatus Jorgensenbacteria bacterium GW2011_GWA1_48_11 TaxID=1618660 RepID=A0A0G1WME1_9BACT|nr:MAG: hypothetical protein UY23_C0001G0109 [Candidatus Jorgensenbacteria bacterium GW2011_GWA1_48_11]KKW11996.1 MAG: hypothetical protein UY51_C0005G0238 [Candidatus Jorgensenbacteria bacterium GW2011_GWB1_49_9]
MAKKFQSFLKDRTAWRLLSKTVFATLILFWAWRTNFGFWPTAIFITVLLYDYFSLPEERKFLRASFWLLPLAAYLGLAFVNLPVFGPLTLFLFALLFFLVLGLAALFFQDRFVFYNVLNTGLLIMILMPIFYLIRPTTLFGWLLAVFALTFFIWRECFRFFGLPGRRLSIAAFVLAFLAAELAVGLMFLPIGFMNAAAFLVLILLLTRDGIATYFKGVLNLSFLFRQLTFFVFFAILILATARWSVY